MKCPECGKDISIEILGDPTDYSKGMGKLTSEYKVNRIWQTAENLATSAFLDTSSKSRSKEKLLELFKYYLRELMKSEGE